jgi:uncharacterized protein (DUF2384 family)
MLVTFAEVLGLTTMMIAHQSHVRSKLMTPANRETRDRRNIAVVANPGNGGHIVLEHLGPSIIFNAPRFEN